MDVNSIKDYHLSKNFKFNVVGGFITIDLGLALHIDNIFVAETDATSVTIQGNTTSDFTTPAFSTTLTDYSNNWFGKQKLNKTYRYWKLIISGGSKLAYLYMGDELQLPGINPEIEIEYGTTASTALSVTLQSYGDKGINYFSSAFEFPIITDTPMQINGKDVATREDILTFWYDNQGTKPVVFLIFEESLDVTPPMMAIISQNSLIFKLDRTHASWSLKFKVQQTF